MTDEELSKAHFHSMCNKAELKQSKTIGCFDCCEFFKFDEITDWTDLEPHSTRRLSSSPTAICPKCGIDSVIGDGSGFEVTDDLLKALYEKYFGPTPRLKSK